jgi:hypothetical protein
VVIRLTLEGLAAGAELGELARSLQPFSRRHSTWPGDVLVELAADALELGSISRTSPLNYSGLRERYLPERRFSGNTDHQKSPAALRLAAMTYAGVAPDLSEEAGWWRADDFWVFALYATVIYIRAVAERTTSSTADICEQLGQRHGIPIRP